MGIICPTCGVIIDEATSTNMVTFIFSDGGRATGQAVYSVNVCADRASNLFQLTFTDTDGMDPNRSFTFTGTTITSVSCSDLQGECRVIIQGTGIVNGMQPELGFGAIIRDRQNPALEDFFESIDITGFATQEGVVTLDPQSVTAFGCS